MALIHGQLKRTILARIEALDLSDDLGEPVQVLAAPAAQLDRQAVYPGVVRWSQRELTAERSLAMQQTITVEIRIRVEHGDGDIDNAEMRAEATQRAIAAGVVAEPFLLGGAGSLVATSGDADPTVVAPDPDPKVIVNLGLTFTAVVNTGGA